MLFNNYEELKSSGFEGFKILKVLIEDTSIIPNVMGIYLLLYLNQSSTSFLEKGTGGFYKGKDPNVPISVLESNWVNDTNVLHRKSWR